MKLFAYICNRMKPNNITKQNITKMKTKIFTLLLNKSLLSKLALIALLLTGGAIVHGRRRACRIAMDLRVMT